MKKVRLSDIQLGEALPWAVYDRKGKLLLKQGAVINSRNQLETLVRSGVYMADSVVDGRGIYIDIPDAEIDIETALDGGLERASAVEIFNLLEPIKLRLKAVHGRIYNNLGRDIPGQVYRFCHGLQTLCEEHTDTLLASIQLDHAGPYLLTHMLHAGVLTELLARRAGWSRQARLPLLAAALTHDISVPEFDGEEYNQKQLSVEMRALIDMHPRSGVELLRSAGVREATWLDAVENHHERLDGTGYPNGLVDAQVSSGARILALADIYSAMVRDRPYRGAYMAKDALREMFLTGGDHVDHGLTQMLIKELGVFPPGALVKLKSGEVGVVTARGEDSRAPQVWAILSALGTPYPKPHVRDTAQAGLSIAGAVSYERFRFLDIDFARVWSVLSEGAEAVMPERSGAVRP